MENALFLNNKSNFSSYSCIDNKQSDQWVKDKLKDLYSSNSFQVCEINSKHSKSDLIKNDKNDFPERRNNNESCGNTNEPCCHVKMVRNNFLAPYLCTLLSITLNEVGTYQLPNMRSESAINHGFLHKSILSTYQTFIMM